MLYAYVIMFTNNFIQSKTVKLEICDFFNLQHGNKSEWMLQKLIRTLLNTNNIYNNYNSTKHITQYINVNNILQDALKFQFIVL